MGIWQRSSHACQFAEGAVRVRIFQDKVPSQFQRRRQRIRHERPIPTWRFDDFAGLILFEIRRLHLMILSFSTCGSNDTFHEKSIITKLSCQGMELNRRMASRVRASAELA